jgi:hypothetical protein
VSEFTVDKIITSATNKTEPLATVVPTNKVIDAASSASFGKARDDGAIKWLVMDQDIFDSLLIAVVDET